MKRALKTIAHAVITVVLVFALLGSVAYRNEGEPIERHRWDVSALAGLPTADTQLTPVDGAVTFAPTGDDPQMYLHLDPTAVNMVVLTFPNGVPSGMHSQIYFSTDGALSEGNSTVAMQLDGTHLVFRLPDAADYTLLRIDLADESTLSEIVAYELPLNVVRTLNPVPLAVLLVAIVALALTERKFGYFAFLSSPVRRAVATVRRLYLENRRGAMLLHLAALVFTALYLGFLAVALLLGLYTHALFLWALAGAALAIAFSVAAHAATGEGREAATLFLTVAILAGLLLCYTMPIQVGVSWDDETHFRRAFNWMHLFSTRIDFSEAQLMSLGIRMEDFWEDPMAAVMKIEHWNGVTVDYYHGICNPYTAVSYLPVMISIGFGDLFSMDLSTMLLLARIANLVTYATVIWFGIRRLKAGAGIISAVALLPTALFLACSINYDFWLTSWLAFVLCRVISVLQDRERHFTTRDVVAILVGCFLAFSPKAIYCAMMLPLFFLPSHKFESPRAAKRFRLWVLLTLVFIAATLIVPGLVVPDLYTDTRGGADVSTGGQIAHILTHPFEYAWVLLRFLGGFCTLSNLNSNGAFFAYLGPSYSFFGTVAAFLLLYAVYTDRREDDGYELMQPTRWMTLFTCFVTMVLVATSLYVGFTPVGSPTIGGMSYRYIFPILVPFCFFMAPKKLYAKVDSRFQSAFLYGGFAVAVLGSYFQAFLAPMIL